jgi:hypothetical protein
MHKGKNATHNATTHAHLNVHAAQEVYLGVFGND